MQNHNMHYLEGGQGVKTFEIKSLIINYEDLKFTNGNIFISEDRVYKSWTVDLMGVEKSLSMSRNYNLFMKSNNDNEYSGLAFISHQSINNITFQGTGVLKGFK
jgi:hypothetical protein